MAPIDSLLEIEEAADLLGVSLPYLTQLLEAGKIPFRMIGTGRKVRLCDVLEYRTRQDAAAEQAFAELVAQAQELRMGYR